MLRRCRILAGIGAMLLAGTAAVSVTTAGAAPGPGTLSDVVTFSGKAFVVSPSSPNAPGFATLVTATCDVKSADELSSVACDLAASARLTLTAGTISGSVTSADGTISFDETYTSTGPTAGTISGTVTETDPDDPGPTSATVTGSVTFSTALSDPGDVVDFTGKAVVRDNPGQPGDHDVTTTCMVTALRPGPPKQQDVTVQDTGSGLASISNIQITNGTVHVPQFTQGTTAPVVVTATKTNQARPTTWSFDATNLDGTTTHCQ